MGVDASEGDVILTTVSLRSSTRDDYQRRIDRVRAHLEEQLSEPLNLQELASVACLSPCHFHRVFRAMTGERLGEHLRRVRLERAALLLRHSSSEISEVALLVGYESPAAFTRAFERSFGSPPSVWRTSERTASIQKPNVSKPAWIEPLRFVKRKPVRVSFVRRTGPYAESAPEAWQVLMRTLAWSVWLHFPAEMIGICHDDPDITAAEHLRYDACLRFRRSVAPQGEVEERWLPGGRYAVFLHRGPHVDLPLTYERIYGAWLPEGNERLTESPAFEVYLDRPGNVAPEKLRTLVHVPLHEENVGQGSLVLGKPWG